MRLPSRRWSGEWGRSPAWGTGGSVRVDVLVPTAGRVAELAVTLAGLAAQDDPAFSVIVSDQSEDGSALDSPAVTAMVRVLRAQGRPVELVRHLPRHGLAEHRQFLLDRSHAEHVLFLDDDVWLEPGTLRRMVAALDLLGCGFVGSAVQGLSYLHDDRPGERAPYEPWDCTVQPETIRPGSPETARASLHNAANLCHLARELPVPRDGWVPYKVAWVGGCVLYRRSALVACGGFDFWDRLPPVHSGEDVAAQWRVMERSGGAGILPSGAVHLEAPTTVPERPVDAPDVVFGSTAVGRSPGRRLC